VTVDVLKVDHVAHAVNSLADGVRLYIETLGGRFVTGGDSEREDIRTIQLELGGVKLELMQPLGEDSYLQRFIDKHGQGFHHMTIFVDDLHETIATLEAAGYEVVDTDDTSPPWRETYVRPRSGLGALIQVVQTNMDWSGSFPGVTLEAVLNGDVQWRDNIPTLRGPDEPRPLDPAKR
jgi:methylmalonyl-CoA/ethylmalonyl-CoA epimerase